MNDKAVEIPSSAFNFVFVCILALTLVILGGCYYSSFWIAKQKQVAAMNKIDLGTSLAEVEKLDEVLRYGFTLGCGAVFGLIGGKAIQ